MKELKTFVFYNMSNFHNSYLYILYILYFLFTAAEARALPGVLHQPFMRQKPIEQALLAQVSVKVLVRVVVTMLTQIQKYMYINI